MTEELGILVVGWWKGFSAHNIVMFSGNVDCIISLMTFVVSGHLRYSVLMQIQIGEESAFSGGFSGLEWGL